MDTIRRLEEVVKHVRKTYFPKWDRKGAWVIKYDPENPEVEFVLGKCLKETKIILLRNLPEKDVELYLLLIHEICHVFAASHELKWQRRMLKIAEKATQNEENELSEKIIKEVELYKNSPRVTAETIYGKLIDWVYDTRGEVPFENIRRALAREYGGYDVIDRLKKLRRIYDKTVKNIKESEEAQSKLRKMLEERSNSNEPEGDDLVE